MKKLNQTGDTIIEVLVSATILALVLSVSFVSANRSLEDGVDAASRNQATEYASQQIELMRVAINNGVTLPANGDFCMNATTQKPVVDLSLCNQAPFSVDIKYNWDFNTNAAVTNHAYSVVSQWPAVRSNTPNQVVLYYQDPQ